MEGGRGTARKDSWGIRGEGCLKNHKNQKIDKKTMLKTYSENDAKKVPKGSQKGCQEGFKIEILGVKMGTRSDVSTHSVSQVILKRIFMKN